MKKKSTDKVEPKFHPGDWITDGQLTCKVLRVTNKSYELHLCNDDYCHFETDVQSVDKYYHLWTIKDAKDGDVLSFYIEHKGNKMVQTGIIEKYIGKHGGCSNTFKVYVGVNWENNFQIGEYMGCSDIRPSTKEQYDTLFARIKGAGYRWDSEKKELWHKYL